MYIHPAFAMHNDDAIAFLETRAFGVLVVPTVTAPVAVHAPFIVDRFEDGRVAIELHVAKANPIHELLAANPHVLLICSGADAYISPDWYGLPNQVPTWTYLAVHVTGTAGLLPDDGKLAHADRLSAQFEEQLLPKKPWTSAKMDAARRDAMLRAIVGVRIDVNGIEAQRKLVQHKDKTAQLGAMRGLLEREDSNSTAIANEMQMLYDAKFGE